MHEIYTQSLAFVMESVGPDYLPQEWMRGTMPRMNVPTEQLRQAGGGSCRAGVVRRSERKRPIAFGPR